MFDRNEQRKQRKAAGICIDCGAQNVSNGSRCVSCAEKSKLQWKLWYEKKKSKNLCAHCGNSVVTNKALCDECLSDGANRAKIRASNRRNVGNCIECDKAAVERNLCEHHLQRRQQQIQQTKEKRACRRQNGFCEECGGAAVNSTDRKMVNCKNCYLKRVCRGQIAKKRLNETIKWQELDDLFSKKPICPYTGIELQMGVNASVDHVVPIDSGGDKGLENLQFVYCSGNFDVNLMKGTMTDSEFKEAIKVLYHHMFKD